MTLYEYIFGSLSLSSSGCVSHKNVIDSIQKQFVVGFFSDMFTNYFVTSDLKRKLKSLRHVLVRDNLNLNGRHLEFGANIRVAPKLILKSYTSGS